MANISVRRLEDSTVERLRQRAQLHGVSMEAEVRRILEAALAEPTRLGDLAISTFGLAQGIDLELPAHPVHPAIELAP